MNIVVFLVGILLLMTSNANAVIVGYSRAAAAGSSYSFEWSAASDSAEVPSGKTLTRTGNGAYISSGCYSGTCYDNVDTASSIKVPIVNSDIIDINDFSISFYFNPQTIANYGYLFGVGSNSTNAHLVHTYTDGRVYCRTTLNGTQYFGYVLNTGSEVVVGTWYKLTYEYSASGQFIKVYINDVLKLTINSVAQTMQGAPSFVYFSADYAGEGRSDTLIDEVKIQ